MHIGTAKKRQLKYSRGLDYIKTLSYSTRRLNLAKSVVDPSHDDNMKGLSKSLDNGIIATDSLA